MAYATEAEEMLARRLGYDINRSEQKGSSFKHDKRHVWSTRIGWQTADLVSGTFHDHMFYEKLPDALRRDL